MGFRETVAAEPLDLLETLLGKFRRIAALGHAFHDSLAEGGDFVATRLPRSECTTELVRFACREPCRNNGKLHRLFLKERYSQCSFQNSLDQIVWIAWLLFPVAPPKVRMHHVSLNRPRPH